MNHLFYLGEGGQPGNQKVHSPPFPHSPLELSAPACASHCFLGTMPKTWNHEGYHYSFIRGVFFRLEPGLITVSPKC